VVPWAADWISLWPWGVAGQLHGRPHPHKPEKVDWEKSGDDWTVKVVDDKHGVMAESRQKSEVGESYSMASLHTYPTTVSPEAAVSMLGSQKIREEVEKDLKEILPKPAAVEKRVEGVVEKQEEPSSSATQQASAEKEPASATHATAEQPTEGKEGAAKPHEETPSEEKE